MNFITMFSMLPLYHEKCKVIYTVCILIRITLSYVECDDMRLTCVCVCVCVCKFIFCNKNKYTIMYF